MFKRCPKCRIAMHVDTYCPTWRTRKNGLPDWCRTCTNAYTRARNKAMRDSWRADPEKWRAYKKRENANWRRWAARNKAKNVAKVRAWVAKQDPVVHKEKLRAKLAMTRSYTLVVVQQT